MRILLALTVGLFCGAAAADTAPLPPSSDFQTTLCRQAEFHARRMGGNSAHVILPLERGAIDCSQPMKAPQRPQP